MAILNIQRLILSEITDLSTILVSSQNRMRILMEMYPTEGIADLLENDIQVVVPQATVQKLSDAKAALDVIYAAIGDFGVGTPATKLLRFLNSIPR
jgi:hypothetical protein